VSYDPAMMVALLLYAYARGIPSSRVIERECIEDIAFRVIAAQQQPDRATIARYWHGEQMQSIVNRGIPVYGNARCGAERAPGRQATACTGTGPVRRSPAVRVPRADGRLSSRRGYATRAAAVTARHELIVMLRADIPATDPSQFDAFFVQIVNENRAYLTVGALEDLESHGRTRLIPFFAGSELATIDEPDVRDWLALMYQDVEAGEVSAETVNNTRTWLAVVFNEAVRRRLMPRNPCQAVPRLPHGHTSSAQAPATVSRPCMPSSA